MNLIIDVMIGIIDALALQNVCGAARLWTERPPDEGSNVYDAIGQERANVVPGLSAGVGSIHVVWMPYV
jgi:hypothetical protein